jgi:hypothetical protein
MTDQWISVCQKVVFHLLCYDLLIFRTLGMDRVAGQQGR